MVATVINQFSLPIKMAVASYKGPKESTTYKAGFSTALTVGLTVLTFLALSTTRLVDILVGTNER